MEKNAFMLVAGKVGTVLKGLGCEQAESQELEKDGKSAAFVGQGIAYGIVYMEDKKRFELRTCDAEDGVLSGKWKTVSMWLFDPENDTSEEADNIADDFIATVSGPVATKTTAVRKKKRRKNDDDNVDSIFFFNRFVGIFPELKEELSIERASYGGVRAVTFARRNLLPKLERLCAAGTEKSLINRCASLMNEMYFSGDVDVRSIITIVLLNGLSDQAVANLKPSFNPGLAKGYKAGLKMKGKRVKPEKKKKRSKIMSDTLNEMGQ